MARYKSNRDRVQKQIERDLKRRLSIAGEFVETAAKLLVAVDTGNLRASISHRKVAPFTEQIGTTVNYAAFIELGTRFMAARPYLLPALIDNRREIKHILSRKR